MSNDKQVGVEKLWDAFERLKTFYEDVNKRESAERITKEIADGFEKDFIENEFKNLTKIGNSYRIRHHETNKKELKKEHINYFFFRMLSLIDLCLVYLNDDKDLNWN